MRVCASLMLLIMALSFASPNWDRDELTCFGIKPSQLSMTKYRHATDLARRSLVLADCSLLKNRLSYCHGCRPFVCPYVTDVLWLTART